MNECIFCKIVNKEIPCYKVYEDEEILAFLDIGQATIGHTLVVSKKHYDDLLTIPTELLAKIIAVAQKIAIVQMNTLPNIKGVNLLNNCKEIAGQAINHFHLHVIPRYEKDDYHLEPATSHKLTNEDFIKLVEELKKGLTKC